MAQKTGTITTVVETQTRGVDPIANPRSYRVDFELDRKFSGRVRGELAAFVLANEGHRVVVECEIDGDYLSAITAIRLAE